MNRLPGALARHEKTGGAGPAPPPPASSSSACCWRRIPFFISAPSASVVPSPPGPRGSGPRGG